MKRLLLVLLVSGTAILAAGHPPVASADCVHHRYFYYEYPGGPQCGYAWVFCEAPTHQVGCQTPYYTYVAGCICP